MMSDFEEFSPPDLFLPSELCQRLKACGYPQNGSHWYTPNGTYSYTPGFVSSGSLRMGWHAAISAEQAGAFLEAKFGIFMHRISPLGTGVPFAPYFAFSPVSFQMIGLKKNEYGSREYSCATHAQLIETILDYLGSYVGSYVGETKK